MAGAGLPRPHITDEERERINPFDWDSKSAGFGEIIGRGGFDCVIGNPPYGAELSLSEKEYIKENFKTKTQDTAAYFLEKAWALSRRNFGMIVPKTIAFYSAWQSIREFLLDKAALYTLLDAGVAFEEANYEQLVLCFEKASSKKKVVIRRAEPVKRYTDQKQILAEGAVPASYTRVANVIIFRGVSKEEQSVIDKIYSSSIPLGEICEDSFRGLYIPDSEKEVLKEGSWRFVNKVPDVQRYSIEKVRMIDISHNEKYLKLAERILQPRIFFKVLRGERLVAYPDVKGEYLTTEKLVNFVVKKGSNYHYNALAGVINSRVPSFYIQRILFSRTTETSRVMDLIYSQYIPLPKINFLNKRQKKLHDDLVVLVDRMLELNKKRHTLPVSSSASGGEMVGREIAVTDERIDDLVYGLYGITKEERKIIEGEG